MVSILKQGSLLIVSVPSTADDRALRGLLDDLSVQVTEHRSRGVLIDVSSLDVLDSYATSMLQTIAAIVKLRGAATVIVGIQPDVAMAMVQLGLTLKGIHTAIDLEDGIRLLRHDNRGGPGGH